MSGISSTYVSEVAERRRALAKLEAALVTAALIYLFAGV